MSDKTDQTECQHDYGFMAIMSSRKGVTSIDRCRKCGKPKKEFASSCELRLWQVQQQHLKIKEMIARDFP